MGLPRPTAYRNGHNQDQAPLQQSGASVVPQTSAPPLSQPRTVFPNDARLQGPNALFYLLHRFQIGGIPAARWLAFLWLSLAAIWALGFFPGRWVGTAFWLLIFALQVAGGIRARRRDYIDFMPEDAPALDAAPLTPSEKLPIHATGLFSVEGKYQRFSWLPGFYRTFATGEHAILCLMREQRRWGLLSSPQEEAGMWYAFIEPDSLIQLRWGTLAFGKTKSSAIAATYRLTIPPSARRKQPLVREETIYLAFDQAEDGQRLYVDLAQHLPQPSVARDSTPVSHR